MKSVCLTLLVLAAASTAWAGEKVEVWMSTQDGAKSLTREKDLEFGKVKKTKGPVITLSTDKTLQSIVGLGASLEHSTCENLTKLPPDKREEVIEKLVSPDRGIGMNLMRVCIGTSDFTGEPYYTYNDLPEGQTDPELAGFSIEKDKAYVLPVIKTALAKNPDLLIFASPWSPPAWMKTGGKLGTGKLKPEFYGAWANYLLKFIRAYEAEGVPIYAITVQNEPNMSHPGYPTTLWNGEEQRDFIRDHLGPLFRDNNVKTLVWCWDHNWNNLAFPRAVMADPQAAQYVDGTGFHLYEGRVDAQTTFRNEFPGKHIYFTEGSVFRAGGAVKLANILRNWSRTYSGWVVMLDEHQKPNRGPHTASPTAVELLDDGSVRYNFDYYMQGQFMKFIRRGAVQVESTPFEGKTLAAAAFKNPDGRMVLVAANAGRAEASFAVVRGESMLRAELPAQSVATYLWTPEN